MLWELLSIIVPSIKSIDKDDMMQIVNTNTLGKFKKKNDTATSNLDVHDRGVDMDTGVHLVRGHVHLKSGSHQQ